MDKQQKQQNGNHKRIGYTKRWIDLIVWIIANAVQ